MRPAPFLLAGALVLALIACRPPTHAPALPKGDEMLPGDVQVAGMRYCEAARLELAAIVLNGPPKPAALADVRDARAPGCTWVASSSRTRVRLSVFDATMFAATHAASPAAQFDALAAHHARTGQGTEAPDLGVRAALFGFATPESDGALIVETPTRVYEFEGKDVSAPKLTIFARGVIDNIENADGGAQP